MKQWEQPSSDARQVDFGEMSSLTDVEEVAPAVIDLLGTLFNDHEPQGEDGRRVVFVFGASVLRARTGIAEMDETLRETYLAFDDRPRAEWHVEADLDAITALARTLVHSRERPDTQIAGPAHLELLVRDETEHTALLAPQGSATVHEVPTAKGTCTVTVGPPSAALLLRLGLRRTGMEHLTGVFDRERTSAHLIEQERRRGLAEGAVARISARRLLMETAEPRLLSVRLDGPPGLGHAELELVATAFRVRLAYESDIALVPVLDVGRLDGSSQPRLVRQLPLRAQEFVEAIGQGTAGHTGDRLLGPAPVVREGQEIREELSQRYLRAMAASDPFAAFMGYYQVLEYSMEEEWFQALRRRVESVGGVLERPADGIRKAAKPAADALGERTEDLRFFEIRGLKAVLDRHLDISALATDLDRYLLGAADHFATGTVPFARVPHLDFGRAGDAAGRATLREGAAERIYQVRCAITHSKESGDSYSPYTDELALGREVPLVRIAAEHLLFPADERL
nr:hypothetical protein OG999_40625 [Streptomyces sp. NBC_00886]